MRKVLVYCTKLWSNGGIESHVLQFCERMSKEDIQIDFLVPEFSFRKGDAETIRSYCRKFLYCKSQNKHFQKIWLLSQLLFLRKTVYDAIYTNGQGESFWLVGKFLRYHKWVHHHHQSGDNEDQATWGKRYKQSLLTSDSVIACSNNNASLMENALRRKINVVTCFSRKIELKESTPSSPKIRFGYFGRLIPEKGINYLCQLSEDADIKSAEFHIWGEGKAYPPEYFTKYPNIIYHGPFSGKEGLTTAVSSIDAFLLLSHHPEGLPISLLEVMSAGIPWLASDRGGIKDIACDPLSTRVIDFPFAYEKAKMSVLDFVEDLKKGKISKTAQIKLYNSRFSSEALAVQWKKVLFEN